MLSFRRPMAVFVVAMLLVAGKTARELLSAAAAGVTLTDDQAKGVAVALQKNEDDADLRAQLLGYDLARKVGQREARAKSIFWMIAHRPADPITATPYCMIDAADDPEDYAKGKELWDQQLGAHSNDAIIIANGAAFRATADFADAEGMLQQAETLEPKNSAWPERIAQLEERRMTSHPDEAPKLAIKALQQRQLAYNLTRDPLHRFHVLMVMPDDAVQSQDLLVAKRLANQLVGTANKFRDDPAYGDAIHRGNIVLGEEELEAGNMDRAEEYLTAAGETPGSPTLATTGPDLKLAKKLLARGERTAVRAYLAQCTKFWKDGGPTLKSWMATLDTGGMPDLRN